MITLISLLLLIPVIEEIGSECDKSGCIGCYWAGAIRDLLIVFNAFITWVGGAQWCGTDYSRRSFDLSLITFQFYLLGLYFTAYIKFTDQEYFQVSVINFF